MKSLWQYIVSPSNSRTLGLLALLVLTAAIPLTVYVAQQQQRSQQVAQEAPSLRVFATTQQDNGNLGGVSGADAKCQQVADSVPTLSGSKWKAWVSSSSENAKDRISDGKYVRLDGAVIANNKQDLLDGHIQNAINKNELSQTFEGRAWTGTSQVGSVLGTQTTPTPTPPECGVRRDKPNGCTCNKNNQCASDNCGKPPGEDDRICLGGQTPTPTQSPTNTPTPTPTSAAPPPTSTPTPTSDSSNYRNCNNWTSSDSGVKGMFGSTKRTNHEWTNDARSGCDNTYSLYCFEQTSQTPPTETPTPTPTLPPGVTPTPTPTLPPGVTPSPTPTPTLTGTRLKFDLALEGISSNPEAGNINPRDPERELEVRIFAPGGNQIQKYEGTIAFQRETGRFTGTIATPNLAGGTYDIRVKTDKYLTRLFANQPIILDSENVLRPLTLIAGDVSDDNAVDITDYTLVTRVCFGTRAAFDQSCNRADIDDDGDVDIFDANFVIRSMAIREGE